MDNRLQDVLNNREGNYLLPFLWMHSNRRDRLPGLIRSIYDSGARAFCVESRPHDHFCEDEWWGDMDVILAEARKRDMKVWILDDKHFPTGYANGLVMKKYPNLRKWFLIEEHVDVLGPMPGCTQLIYPKEQRDPEDSLVGVFAYRHLPGCEEFEGEPINLTGCVRDNFLIWDVPEGAYRVFYLYKSRRGATGRAAEYMDMISGESVHVLIEAVYEPHFQHYGEYFGSTIAGFFSDEPSFGNELVNWAGPRGTMYDNLVGTRGLSLPWSEELLEKMNAELGYDALPYLGGLWYPLNGGMPELRVAYMNAATKLWEEHFSRQLGDWCRAHKVEYIGHIIEDMNAHAHLGCSGGHFFRSLNGQDMSGIDIVLHQYMPGFADYPHSASCSGGVMDTEFFHYVLGKLAASHARLNPQMKGRAMCEVFGAYGWAEGTDLMKAMMDFLLVRGVNHFVPHAYSPDYPDPDCPPHFSAQGENPQFGAFSALMRYVNKVSHLLTDARHVANAAILYHAEAEWSGKRFMRVQKPAKVLYDRQIDYDIVPLDYLIEQARVEGGKLLLENGEARDCLVVPGSEFLPDCLVKTLRAFAEAGLPVWFVGWKPDSCDFGEVVAPDSLADQFVSNGFTDVTAEPAFPLLRVLHLRRSGADLFMLSNESVQETADVTVKLPVCGGYTRLDLQLNQVTGGETADGSVRVRLTPYQSVLLVFDGEPSAQKAVACRERIPLKLRYRVAAADSRNLGEYRDLCETDELVNMTGFDSPCGVEFSGIVRYEAEFDAPEGAAALSLGRVGQTARVVLNGVDLGWRMCPPFDYDLRNVVRPGRNTLTVYTANTLGNRLQDHFTHFIPMPPAGLFGPVELIRE